MIGLTLSVNYLSSDAYGGLRLRADRSLGSMKLAITDYNLSNPDNSCDRIHFGQVFECV